MRKAFAETLFELMERDDRIVLLTADLGFRVFDKIIEQFPKRFINVGVAEQNMVGIATGLAEAGFIPFVYSIVTFATLRSYEFIRNGPVLHHLPVRIIGMGGGFEYGSAGITHHGLEDICVMRIQPGMTVIVPADSAQAATALRSSYLLPGPVYYRLGKNDHISIPELGGRFELGTADIIRTGKDFLWVTTGPISAEIMKAANILSNKGIDSTVCVVASVKPAPLNELTHLAAQFPFVITVETHYKTGGIGTIMAEIIAEHGLHCHLLRRGIPDKLEELTGSQQYYETICGLNAEKLVSFALRQMDHALTA